MSPNKRKILDADVFQEDDSFKHRRSSLRVNLSCVTNLTDSGNCSLRRTHIEYNASTDGAKSPTELSKEKQSHNGSLQRSLRTKKAIADQRHAVHSNCIKEASVLLERINNDEQMLSKNCDRLKDAILSKTKEIFDKKNELSIKTYMVLGSNVNQEHQDTYTTASNNSEHTINRNEGSELRYSIKSTPKDRTQSKVINQLRNKSKLKKTRLFAQNETLDDTDTRSTNVSLKTNTSKAPVIRTVENLGSPILSSNKKLSRSRFSLKPSQTLLENSHSKPRFDKSICSISSISEDENAFVPIGCSTMIDDPQAQEDEIDGRRDSHYESLNVWTKKDIVSMEITDVRGGFIIDTEDQLSTKGQSTIQQNNENIHVSEDNMTMQTSMNVNTSIDVVNEANKIQEKSVALEKEQESLNTTCTSLQMNTSLGSPNRLGLHRRSTSNRKSSVKSVGVDTSNSSNVNDIENISLIERLRNISIPFNTTSNLNNKNVGNKHIQIEQEKRDDSSKNQSKRSTNESKDGQSYVEATPYPTSRSVLLRSQLRNICSLIERNKNNNSNERTDTEMSNSKIKSQFPKVNIGVEHKDTSDLQEKTTQELIIVDDSLPQESSKPQKTLVIEDSTTEIQLQEDQSIKRPETNVSNAEKKSKKKLLPLRETSQLLSFSPLQEEIRSPKGPTFTRRRRKVKKKSARKKLNSGRDGSTVNNINHTQNVQLCSDDDLNSFHDGKKEQKKKPRKILSKKIVVKKIVNEDIWRNLEKQRENLIDMQTGHSGGSRNSLNDFQDSKRLTHRSQRNRLQKIVIVTTGLSKEDKSLVKTVVQSLGMARMEANVTRRTTHIVSTGVRTINLLHGIIRGCWLVSLDWVLKSLEKNEWLSPENYEMTHFSKAVMENRKDRQLFGAYYIPELFATCGHIYVESDTVPPCSVLKDLIKAAGGYITENPQSAKIVIGSEGLKENWVLDCITTGELQSRDQYERN